MQLEIQKLFSLITGHFMHLWYMGRGFPFFRTIPLSRICGGGFLFSASIPASIRDKYLLANLPENMAKPPYVLARLVNGDKPVTKRWYVVFRVWDMSKGLLVRKRDYGVNRFNTRASRLEHAKKVIAIINKHLEAGDHVNPVEKKKQDIKITVSTNRDFTIDQAIRYIMPIVKQTKRPETYTSYNSVAGLFLRFCEAAGWANWKVKTLVKSDIIRWLDHVQTSGAKIANTSRNNYKTAISALFTMMVEREILLINPALGIKELKEDVTGNTAFTLDQIAILKPAILKSDPRLWLYITFMLYGFIRPGEIERLRVKMIDMERNTINLPGDITKNHYPKRVKVSKPFRDYILQLNLSAYQPNDYVFGYNLQPGIKPIQKNCAGNLHRKIIKPLGFGGEYSRYSWKHTGVINHYKAGIDIKTLQAQIGHQSLHETDIYLRSLNLYENTEIEDKSPVI